MKRFFLITSALVILSMSFTIGKNEEISFQLFYTKNYPGDSWSNHRTGLLWALSYLGATLPKGSLDTAIHWRDSVTFNLRFEGLGFNPQALKAWKKLTDSLKNTAYYQKYNRLDLGAFVSLTVGSSPDYYVITGVPRTLTAFYSLHHFNHYSVFPVSNSGVAKHKRLLKYKTSSPAVTDWAFVAEDRNSGNPNAEGADAYEVYDIMSNGQLRFAVYDKKGNLLNGSPAKLSKAGKPAKCMWCHEISILPLFTKNDAVANYITPEKFDKDIADLMSKLKTYRQGLKSDIDFNKTQDHTQMELVYTSYMQPGIRRLAQELRISDAEATNLVKHLKKIKHEEFAFLGELVNRVELKNNHLSLPQNIRETSSREPDLFQE
jgi:hypothetical protein